MSNFYTCMVNPEHEVWIRERDPPSTEARLAEAFMSARKGPRPGYFGREPRFTQPSKSYQSINQSMDQGWGLVPGGFKNRSALLFQLSPVKKKNRSQTQEVRCYNCNKLGPTQRFCPMLKSKPLLCPVPRPAAVPTRESRGRTTLVLVNGQKVKALLDSGCF